MLREQEEEQRQRSMMGQLMAGREPRAAAPAQAGGGMSAVDIFRRNMPVRTPGIRGLMEAVRRSQSEAASPTNQGPVPQAQEMQAPVAQFANGGSVMQMPGIPTLEQLAQPNFQMQPASISEAPFTQTNPLVPMASTIGPAFGGMDQRVYDWTAPKVSGGQMQQPDRGAPAQTMGTSTYTPVDTSRLGGMNIPGAEQIAASALPGIQERRRIATLEEQAAQERAAAEQRAQEEAQAMRMSQLEEMQRRQEEFERQLAQQGQMSQQQFQDYRSSFESQLDERVNQGIMAELARRDAATQAAARAAAEQEAARVAAAQAADAERQRAAQAAAAAAEEARRREILTFLTGGFFGAFDSPAPSSGPSYGAEGTVWGGGNAN
jgi:chemotaxis protein histidine kinase CheA